MKVILLERVGKSGHIGDEVNVKDGFARNFLLPQGKALRATEANRAKFARDRADIEKRNQERREAAAGIAEGLNGKQVIIIRQAGETGQLYGSVSSRDVAEALNADGFTVARSQADLANPMLRMGDPEDDIAPVALFLASDDARYVTGNTLFVDGGAHINGSSWAPDLGD